MWICQQCKPGRVEGNINKLLKPVNGKFMDERSQRSLRLESNGIHLNVRGAPKHLS